MVTIEDKVRAKRAQIAEQRDAVIKQMESLDALKRRLSALEEQAAMLDDLLAAGGEQSTSDVASQIDAATPTVEHRANASAVVLELLSRRPEGMKLSDIVAELDGHISTTSKNPKSVIRNTILNLLNRNRLIRNADQMITDPNAKE